MRRDEGADPGVPADPAARGLDLVPSRSYTGRTMKVIASRVLSLGLILLALPGLPGASAK